MMTSLKDMIKVIFKTSMPFIVYGLIATSIVIAR